MDLNQEFNKLIRQKILKGSNITIDEVIEDGVKKFRVGLSVNDNVSIDAPANIERTLTFKRDGKTRLALGMSGIAETGGNSGSNFFIDTYKDDGTFLERPFSILRSDGLIRQKSNIVHDQGRLPYEQGSWTPLLRGITVTGSPTYTAIGRYRRIGNMVVVNGSLMVTNKGGMEGPIGLWGLPFMAYYPSAGSLGAYGGYPLATPMSLHIDGETDYITFMVPGRNVTAADINDTFVVYGFELTYGIYF